MQVPPFRQGLESHGCELSSQVVPLKPVPLQSQTKVLKSVLSLQAPSFRQGFVVQCEIASQVGPPKLVGQVQVKPRKSALLLQVPPFLQGSAAQGMGSSQLTPMKSPTQMQMPPSQVPPFWQVILSHADVDDSGHTLL